MYAQRLNKPLMLMLILSLFSLSGCSNTETNDEDLLQIPVIEEVDPKMILFEVLSDGMDRGNHEYKEGLAVVDPSYYKDNPVSRGDVILFEHNQPSERDDIARVIGLPGEKIEIKNGQMYIDGNKVTEFYGQEYRYGVKVNNSTANFSITVPEDHYYLMADNWSRWGILDSSTPKDKIIGKVIGITNSRAQGDK